MAKQFKPNKFWVEHDIKDDRVITKKPAKPSVAGSLPISSRNNNSINLPKFYKEKKSNEQKAKRTFDIWWGKYTNARYKYNEINKFLVQNNKNNPFNFPHEKKENVYRQHLKIHEKGWNKIPNIFNEHQAIYDEIDEAYELLKLQPEALIEKANKENEVMVYEDEYEAIGEW